MNTKVSDSEHVSSIVQRSIGKLSVVALLTLALGACVENDEPPMFVPPPLIDGGSGFGCGSESQTLWHLSCNPVTQAGCAAGEKCAELIVVADDPDTSANEFLAQIACVPEGSASAGESCEEGEPGQCTGFDNCVAGYDCFGDVCLRVCGSSPDTCLSDPPAPFGMGENCANNFEDHFNDTTGVCLLACDPTMDSMETTEDGEFVVVNAICGVGSSCGMNAATAKTTCAGTPAMSDSQTQNDVPYGPSAGLYYSNGCASGFTTLLSSNVGEDPGEQQCARYCTPTESYLDESGAQVGSLAGANNKCGNTGLEAIGGRGGNNVAHQCRFIQSLYPNTNLVPAEVGMCMPIESRGREFALSNGMKSEAPLNTWGNCELFAWGELKAAWNAAAPQGTEAANAAFDETCMNLPLDPMNPNARFLSKCIGYFYGCISIAEEGSLVTPTGAARSGGRLLRERFNMHRNATPTELEEFGL